MDKIEELKQRIRNLEERKNKSSLSIGNITSAIPHVYIGSSGIQVGNKPKTNTLPIPIHNVFDEKEQKVINRLKKWGLILAVVVVVGYAAYRIVSGI